ncbi:MAG: DUF2339 domain-containing protein [Planctomycetes bacterium]|nr:DUF2339 domain-containing protein [Planctomycetota bacterium]
MGRRRAAVPRRRVLPQDAYDRDWLGRYFGPRLRLATAAGIALALGIAGWRSLRNGMAGLGQGLLGGSQAVLYLTVYAAFQPALLVVDQPLLGPTAAFALLAVVTALGLAVAVRLDAIAMAFLAVAGGFAAPALIHTGQDSRDALCTYLLVLDLGVLFVALWRRWRAVDLLAFAGTALLFGGWYAKWHHAHPQPDATLLWLAAFHLVFVLVPFAHHLRHRTPVTVERFALALANVAWTFGYAAWMLHTPAPRVLAAGCLGAAAIYAGLGVAVARRVGDDARTRDGFVTIAALLLTLGLFYLLPVDAITTGWAAEAAALLWLGYRYGNKATRLVALAVLLAAVVRTVGAHLPGSDPAAAFVRNRWLLTLAVTGLGIGIFGAIHRRFATNDDERTLSRLCGISAGYWTLAALGLEVVRHAGGHPDAWSAGRPAQAVAALLLIGTLAFLGWAARWPHRATFFAGLLPLAGAVVCTVVAYGTYPSDAQPGLNGCFVSGLSACAVTAYAAWRARRHPDTATAGGALFGAAQLLLTALVTFEVAAYLQRGEAQPTARTMAQALGWAWLAAALAGGFAAAGWSNRRVLALAALPLGCALVAAFVTYGESPGSFRLLANERFALAALACAALALTRPLLHRVGPTGAADVAAAAALALMTGFGVIEASTWGTATHTGNDAVGHVIWLNGLVFVLAAAGGWWRAAATDNRALRNVASLALLPALLLPLAVYLTNLDGSWMFANLRFGLVAAAIAAAALWARRDGYRWLRPACWTVALLALTAEPPTWLLDHVEDPDEARRRALFSVTVTWVLSAATMLFVGFARDLRPVRLGALALLALTAAKLLLLDMSGAQQLYRILAFVLVGVVFVGASWLYHRFERRLLGARRDPS